MKTLDEVKEIKKQFAAEYGPALTKVGNNLAHGIGKDDETGEWIIQAYLTNKKLKSTLPKIYQDVKVNIKVIGIVRPL